MKATHYANLETKENPHGVDVRQIYNLPDAQIMHMTLQAGQALKPHITPVDVFMYVLEGEPTIHIGEESFLASKDFIIESPKGIIHWIENQSANPARLLVGKTPRPENKTRVL